MAPEPAYHSGVPGSGGPRGAYEYVNSISKIYSVHRMFVLPFFSSASILFIKGIFESSDATLTVLGVSSGSVVFYIIFFQIVLYRSTRLHHLYIIVYTSHPFC